MNFEGFGPAACPWFGGLEADNSKTYFGATRDVFEEHVKAPMQALLLDMESLFGGRTKLFRQNRDVRFSQDKSPYKTTTYGLLVNPGHALGWYVAISAAGFTAGRGLYDLDKDRLAAYRDAVAGPDGAAFAAAVGAAEDAGVPMGGDAVKTAPRGYDKDHPRIDLIRRKNLIFTQRLPAAEVQGAAPWEHALKVWDATSAASAWLDGVLS